MLLYEYKIFSFFNDQYYIRVGFNDLFICKLFVKLLNYYFYNRSDNDTCWAPFVVK